MNREYKSVRSEYGKTLVELGKTNPNIVVLDADLSSSTQTKLFAKEFPERFFNVGISEQDLITTAAGLSCTGKIPFVSTFAMFASGRAWEQVRNTICYSNLNVKIAATHGGITVGEDGASHQALEDISLMRSIPNMTVIVPADAEETRQVIKFAAEFNGPVYIRISRSNLPDIFDSAYKFDYKKANIIKEGKDITLITNGETLVETIDCAKILSEKGIDAEIINVPVVKPLDNETIINSAKKTNRVITIENHSIIGGLGSAVCELLSEKYPTKVTRIGTNDEFGQSGTAKELMAFYGLNAEKLATKITGLLK
ncbi:TPA: transketolase family protein [Candidatus Avigastranaerophilus faecigallinarum]|nr:transketolase family protein [Candidatus Avigastranaerophilus faecigallinarum]